MKERFINICLLAYALVLPLHARGETLSDSALAQINFEQKLNSQIAPDLIFRDETGAVVRFGDYFGGKPLILVLGYYECPMLCTLVLNGMIEGLQDIKWSIGKEFNVINVSINPQETPALAAGKKRAYLKRYGRPGAARGWHFLTGEEASIKRIAAEAGFQYAYDTPSKQYAHPSGLVFLTPQGKVAGYLFGASYSATDLNRALKEASSNHIGSPIQRLILLCFHYNPVTGRYGAVIMLSVRLLGAATIVGLVCLVATLIRQRNETQADADATGHECASGASKT